jgi:hypothetical protein
MRTVEEIDKQIQTEHDNLMQLYTQMNSYNKSLEKLKKEREAAEKYESEIYIDKWLEEKFGIKNQKEARNGVFIVFDKKTNFVKTVTCGYGAQFHYISPAEDKDTLEYWLKKNKLYAHSASSFCGRNYSWYQMTFKEQLENLSWEFDKNGRVINAQW